MSDINFDDFQREIFAAEQYLKKKQVLDDSKFKQRQFYGGGERALRSSYESVESKGDVIDNVSEEGVRAHPKSSDIPQHFEDKEDDDYDNDSLGDISTASRYSNPAEREKLISRLLAEHSNHHCTSGAEDFSAAQYRDYGDSDDFFVDNKCSLKTQPISHDSESEPDVAGVSEDILFFASDLGSSLPKWEDDDENDRVSMTRKSKILGHHFDSNPMLSSLSKKYSEVDHNADGFSDDSLSETISAHVIANDKARIRPTDRPTYGQPSSSSSSSSSSARHTRLAGRSEAGVDKRQIDSLGSLAATIRSRHDSLSRVAQPTDELDSVGLECDRSSTRSASRGSSESKRRSRSSTNRPSGTSDENLSSEFEKRESESTLEKGPNRSQPPARLMRPRPQWRYLKSREDLEIEATYKFELDYTFKPDLSVHVYDDDNDDMREVVGGGIDDSRAFDSVNARTRRNSRSRSPFRSQRSRQDIFTRIEEMRLNHEKALREREKMKKDLERSVLQECTFRPEISKGTQQILRSRTQIQQAANKVVAGTLKKIGNTIPSDTGNLSRSNERAEQNTSAQCATVGQTKSIKNSATRKTLQNGNNKLGFDETMQSISTLIANTMSNIGSVEDVAGYNESSSQPSQKVNGTSYSVPSHRSPSPSLNRSQNFEGTVDRPITDTTVSPSSVTRKGVAGVVRTSSASPSVVRGRTVSRARPPLPNRSIDRKAEAINKRPNAYSFTDESMNSPSPEAQQLAQRRSISLSPAANSRSQSHAYQRSLSGSRPQSGICKSVPGSVVARSKLTKDSVSLDAAVLRKHHPNLNFGRSSSLTSTICQSIATYSTLFETRRVGRGASFSPSERPTVKKDEKKTGTARSQDNDGFNLDGTVNEHIEIEMDNMKTLNVGDSIGIGDTNGGRASSMLMNITRGQDVSQRLHEESYTRIEQQKWLEKQVVAERNLEYTFRPFINPTTQAIADSLDYKPIHRRVGEVERAKRENLHTLRAALEETEREQMPFEPKIDKNSRKIAEKKLLEVSLGEQRVRSPGFPGGANVSTLSATDESSTAMLRLSRDVGSRLLHEAQDIARRKQQLVEKREKTLNDSMVPPTVSKGSKAIAQSNRLVGSSFEARQATYQERVHKNILERKREEEEKGQGWFRPQVTNKAEVILAAKRPALLEETPHTRAVRMSYTEAVQMKNRKKEIEAEIYDFSFTPEIDPISKALGREPDLNELYSNIRGKRVKEQARKKAEEVLSEECTFRPKINDYPLKEDVDEISEKENFRHLGWGEAPHICPVEIWGMEGSAAERVEQIKLHAESPFFFGSDISSNDSLSRGRTSRTIDLKQPEKMARAIRIRMREKEARREADRVAREIDALKECTFQPQVPLYIPPTDDEPIVVRGIGRHLELRDLKNKLKEEKLQRERQVFRVEHVERFRRPEDGSTIVRPFLLSSPTGRISRAAQQLQAAEESELTFTPHIIPGNSDKPVVSRLNIGKDTTGSYLDNHSQRSNSTTSTTTSTRKEFVRQIVEAS